MELVVKNVLQQMFLKLSSLFLLVLLCLYLYFFEFGGIERLTVNKQQPDYLAIQLPELCPSLSNYTKVLMYQVKVVSDLLLI